MLQITIVHQSPQYFITILLHNITSQYSTMFHDTLPHSTVFSHTHPHSTTIYNIQYSYTTTPITLLSFHTSKYSIILWHTHKYTHHSSEHFSTLQTLNALQHLTKVPSTHLALVQHFLTLLISLQHSQTLQANPPSTTIPSNFLLPLNSTIHSHFTIPQQTPSTTQLFRTIHKSSIPQIHPNNSFKLFLVGGGGSR